METITSPTPTHPFAHLGPAPYTFANAQSTYDRQAIMAQRKSDGEVYSENTAGSCDHCGMCIHDFYYFIAADGTLFKVGSTCYEKGFIDEQTYADRKALQLATQAKRAMATKKRHTKEARALQEALGFFKAHQSEMDAAPHPTVAGMSLNQYVSWMWENSGTTGKLKAYKIARKALG